MPAEKRIKGNLCVFAIGASVLFCGCSVSKFIPEGQYLLDNVHIESDNKEVKSLQLDTYVRQKPNAKWFSLVKLPLYIYGASGNDSTKWVNKLWRKLGDAPVIYNRESAMETADEIRKAVQNSGYMGATVDLDEQTAKKKIKVRYKVRAGEPYVISHVAYDVSDYGVRDFLRADSAKSLLRNGMRFDVNVLDAERQRITQSLQNNGYFRFNKDFISFVADTMLNTHEVELTMQVMPYRRKKDDVPSEHPRYKVREVNYLLDMDLFSLSDRQSDQFDIQTVDGVNYCYSKKPFLRPKKLSECNFIQPERVYSKRDVQNTYTALGRLHILKYSDIRFSEVYQNDSAYVDAYVSLSRGKKQAVSFEIEGTNSAGDLGAAASVEYSHRNLFRGSEGFSLKLRGAYEAITGMEGYAHKNYTEYGVESSLSFPGFLFPFLSSDFRKRIKATSEVSAKYNWQVRPEFERISASAGWSYRWQGGAKASHRLDLLDVNYVYMPSQSDAFNEYLIRLMEINPLVWYSYTDLFIVKLGYTFTYNSRGLSKNSLSNSYSFRFNIEEAGNLLYGFSKLVNKHPKDGEAFKMGNIDFAQYIKLDLDFSKNFVIDERNSVVFHSGLGVGIPYGNSKSLPFEKLYFSGGANSVRGWHVRSLGPGSYQGGLGSLDYIMRTGDIKLDLNLEYRTFLFWKLNGAAFIDAGNVWNIRRNEDDNSGVFRFKNFYKELAVAYGLGIRFDLDFLILRFDGGMKAINPMATGKERYPIISPHFKRDFAFHFAVGYPF